MDEWQKAIEQRVKALEDEIFPEDSSVVDKVKDSLSDIEKSMKDERRQRAHSEARRSVSTIINDMVKTIASQQDVIEKLERQQEVGSPVPTNNWQRLSHDLTDVVRSQQDAIECFNRLIDSFSE